MIVVGVLQLDFVEFDVLTMFPTDENPLIIKQKYKVLYLLHNEMVNHRWLVGTYTRKCNQLGIQETNMSIIECYQCVFVLKYD